jgi:hypothetical protein
MILHRKMSRLLVILSVDSVDNEMEGEIEDIVAEHGHRRNIDGRGHNRNVNNDKWQRTPMRVHVLWIMIDRDLIAKVF